jgi:hypothetical protein
MPSTISPIEVVSTLVLLYGFALTVGFMFESMADRTALRRAQAHAATRLELDEYRGRMRLARERVRNSRIGAVMFAFGLGLMVMWGARIFVLFFLLVAAVYAASLVYDLVATAQLDGGVPFSWAHFLGLYIRTLVNGLLTAMMSGAVIAVVIASFAQYDGATTTTTEVSITHATTVATQEGEHDPE